MKIKIAERLRPFSHLPGTSFIVPGTAYSCCVFPARIMIYDHSLWPVKYLSTIHLTITGPVEKFTIEQDLERGWVRVWGQTSTGYLLYKIIPHSSNGVAVLIEKAPSDIKWQVEGVPTEIFNKKSDTIPLPPQSEFERLSLGSNKAQDWELMRRRGNLTEIFPIWHRLGQMTAVLKQKEEKNSLLSECSDLLDLDENMKILPAFKNLFLAGFSGGLAPRSEDLTYQGFHLPPTESSNPLTILTEGSRLIRKLFVRVDDDRISILPLLPPDFHSGRLSHFNCADWGLLDLEWTKKLTRRISFEAKKSGILHFDFQKELSRFRLSSDQTHRQQWVSCKTPIEVKAGSLYWLDRFEK